jgi:TolB-like protein/Tfp pilus assembly protein PilF
MLQAADSGIAPPRPSARKTASPTRRWLAGVTVVTAVAIGVALAIVQPFNTSPPVVARNSVAILPFESLPSDAANDYLGEGITQDLASHLGTIRDLRIVAGASTIRFKNAGKSPKDIGNETGVAAVLAGTVQRNANRLNVFVQLIDASSGEQIWSERFERDAANVFSMQAEISRKIAIALRGELSERETERLRQGNGRSFDAFDLYLKGRHAVSLRTADGLRQAVTFFQDAIGRDATFAGAHAGLAEAYIGLGAYGVLPRSEAYARAMEAARRALELDPSLPEAYAALGYADKNRFEWDAAETNFKRAIELRPGYATAHHWYSIYLTQLGRFPEAIAEIQAAISLDPLSVGANQQFAGLLLMARRYQDAISQWERAIQMDPAIVVPYRGIAEAYAHMSLFDKARDAIDEAIARAPQGAEDQELKADRGFVLALSGRKNEARQIARELEERHRLTGEELGGSIAAIYSGLGDTDAAFGWLQKALDTRDPELGYLKVDPRWDGLRSDSRLDVIMVALHLTKLSK